VVQDGFTNREQRKTISLRTADQIQRTGAVTVTVEEKAP
jgi:hypothetical protein